MAMERGPDVVLAGDSLIEYMQMFDFWNELFGPLNCLNLGVGGERTEQVCRRLQGGQLNQINPKVIVLLCGTNNINQSSQEVCEGVMEIVHVITEKQPKAQLIVVGIPPKGQRPNQYRQWAVDINSLLDDKVSQFSNCHFHHMDPALFVKEDGTIDRSDMFDFLHFTGTGYMKWVPKLVEKIKELLNT